MSFCSVRAVMQLGTLETVLYSLKDQSFYLYVFILLFQSVFPTTLREQTKGDRLFILAHELARGKKAARGQFLYLVFRNYRMIFAASNPFCSLNMHPTMFLTFTTFTQ